MGPLASQFATLGLSFIFRKMAVLLQMPSEVFQLEVLEPTWAQTEGSEVLSVTAPMPRWEGEGSPCGVRTVGGLSAR